MGIDISFGDFPQTEVFGWDTCFLVLEMTSPWYDEKRDSDGEYQQIQIDPSSMEAANYELPWTWELYLAWREKHDLGKLHELRYPHEGYPINFERARSFIRAAHFYGDGATVSF